MILIAHRGNISGPKKDLENKPDYITDALNNGFNVEIDLWLSKGGWYLGHDEPQYKTDFSFLNIHSHLLWIHCKDYITFQTLIPYAKNLNFFYHTNEDYVLTSKNYIWAYPNQVGSKYTICVMPELNNSSVVGFAGVCSDYVGKYK